MTTQDDGGPAFPGTWWDRDSTGVAPRESYPGMTLRDWFAGMAMAAMLARRPGERPYGVDGAIAAYNHADAMLAERARRESC